MFLVSILLDVAIGELIFNIGIDGSQTGVGGILSLDQLPCYLLRLSLTVFHPPLTCLYL